MIYHKHIVNHCGRKINIRPFGDLQIGEQGFRQDLWNKWKRDALEDKTSLIIGMGDYSDKFRGKVRNSIRKVLVDDDSAQCQLDDMIRLETQNLAKELKPFMGRFIGLHEGHHYMKFLDGTTSTQYLCQLLKCRYLDFAAGIQIVLRRAINTGNGYCIDMFSTHGCGGASNMHSDLAKLERNIMPYWDADIFLRGHSAKVYAVEGHPLNKFTHNNSNGKDLDILKKQRLLVNTGCFMEAYGKDLPSNYVEKMNLPRVALGWCVIQIHLRDTKKDKMKYPIKISAYAETE